MKRRNIACGYMLFCVAGCVFGRPGDRFSSLSALKEWMNPNPEPGCVLGNKHYHLKQKFSPPIEPYGRLNCLLCQCIPVMKKGILHHHGKVKCVKIENECPIPNCPVPILLPGKCCKSCPGEGAIMTGAACVAGDAHSCGAYDLTFGFCEGYIMASATRGAGDAHSSGTPDLTFGFYEAVTFEDRYSLLPFGLESEVDEALTGDGEPIDKYKSKNYIALLVGKNVPGRLPVYTRAVGIVKLKVTPSGGIQYTLRHERLSRPISIQMMDDNGNVLIQNRLESPSEDNKYCGEWSKVPLYYLRYLHKRKVIITVTTYSYPDGEVSGKPEVDSRKIPETFGVILVSPQLEGIGGYAALTYGLKRRRITYVIMHDGLFNNKRKRQEYFITIEKRTRILHQKTRRSWRKNKLRGYWKNTNNRSRKLLVKGRLRLRLTSKGGTNVIGYIRPAFNCGTYQAVLSTGESLYGRQGPLASAGSAVFNVHSNGDLDYKIRLYNMQSIVTSISVDVPSISGSRHRRIRDLIRTYVRNGTSYNGMATGKITKLRTKDIALLQTGKLHINVATISNRISVLRGRVGQVDHLSNINIFRGDILTGATCGAGYAHPTGTPDNTIGFCEDPPNILTSSLSSPTGVAGHTWITVSDDCTLYYQIVLSGWTGHDQDLTALITGDYGTAVSSNAIYTIIITDFHDGKARGTVTDMSEEVFLSLNRGTSFLHIDVKGQRKGEIRTNLTIPNNCWQVSNDQIPDVFVDEYGRPITTSHPRYNCRYNGVVYKDSDTWRQNKSACATCICNRGDIQCHPVVCPELTCTVKKRSNNGCCPVCSDEADDMAGPETEVVAVTNTSCYYPGDKRWHPAGTRWYPYVPPFGYVTCSICTCEPGTNSYKCTRKECPELDCPRSQAVRVKETDCCQTCPHIVQEVMTMTIPPHLIPEVPTKTGCRVGDGILPNKAQWRRVPRFGLRSCYICRCRGGSIKCRMKRRCRKNNCRKSSCKTNDRRSKPEFRHRGKPSERPTLTPRR